MNWGLIQKIGEYILRRFVRLIGIGVLFLSPSLVHGQISVSGSVSLDTGQARSNYQIEITVRNHTLVVLPNLSILRPVVSQVTQSVSIPAGADSTEYLLSGISDIALDYSIEFRCTSCGPVYPVQFFTPEGNRFSLSDPAYIDPTDFPQSLDFVLESSGQISGEIQLRSMASSDRDIRLRTTIETADASSVLIAQKDTLLRKDTRAVRYSVTGLPRKLGEAKFRVRTRCLNCRTLSKVAIYPLALSPLTDHFDIDFEFEDRPRSMSIPAIILLLND